VLQRHLGRGAGDMRCITHSPQSRLIWKLYAISGIISCMVLDGIDIFVRVVETQSFSAAARQLGIPPTTVSAKIARLEQRLGTTLLVRTTRRVSVTPAGQAYYAHCAEAVKALTAGEEELLAATAEPSGTLRITAPPDLAQVVLAPIVLRFAKAHPKVTVDLVVSNVPLDLIAQNIDLAVRASPMRDSTLTSRRFATGKLSLWASKAYLRRRGRPVSPEDLALHELIVHSRIPPASARLVAGAQRIALPAGSGRITADDMQTIRALCEAGAGIALLPDFSRLEAKPGALERVLPDFATEPSGVHFVYPAQRFVPAKVRRFIDLAIAHVKATEGA
jgi:DNA-binding transcriptional LysR family regulator